MWDVLQPIAVLITLLVALAFDGIQKATASKVQLESRFQLLLRLPVRSWQLIQGNGLLAVSVCVGSHWRRAPCCAQGFRPRPNLQFLRRVLFLMISAFWFIKMQRDAKEVSKFSIKRIAVRM